MKVFNHHISQRSIVFGLSLFLLVFSMSAQSERLARANNNGNDKVKVEVYPNPTSDYLNIDLSDLKLQKPKIEIRSIVGTPMRINLEKNGRDKYKIDVQSFARGYYLVLVMDDRSKFQQTVRFSKK